MPRRRLFGAPAFGAFCASTSGAAAEQQGRGQTPSMVTPGLELSQPFLRLPFRESDAWETGGHGNVSEGWYYGMDRGVHGGENHRAIDFDLPLGTEVLAPADGWAAFTYHSYLMSTEYQGKRIGFGLGIWLITLHKVPGSDVYWWTKMAHLGKIHSSLHYLKPYMDSDGDWHEPNSGPDNLYVPDPQLAQTFTPIKCGQVLGWVGDTGVEWGYRDQFDPETGVVGPRDRHELPAWDADVHLHLEVYRRVNGSPKPGEQLDATRISVDPFGQYGQVRHWENSSPYNGYKLGPGHLWLTGQNGKPLYAA